LLPSHHKYYMSIIFIENATQCTTSEKAIYLNLEQSLVNADLHWTFVSLFCKYPKYWSLILTADIHACLRVKLLRSNDYWLEKKLVCVVTLRYDFQRCCLLNCNASDIEHNQTYKKSDEVMKRKRQCICFCLDRRIFFIPFLSPQLQNKTVLLRNSFLFFGKIFKVFLCVWRINAIKKEKKGMLVHWIDSKRFSFYF
ncbi:hypothetical protein RFI_17049, partial [Reticulomyxa filosa]